MIMSVRSRDVFRRFLGEKCLERGGSGAYNRYRRVFIETPATIANFGPGFDVLAVALEGPRDVLEIEFLGEGNKIFFSSEGIDVPKDDNIVYILAKAFHEVCGGGSLKLKLVKNIPISRGLGSSGASSVATILGLSKIYDLDLTPEEIISLAGYGEGIIAGEPHYDNVSASLLGGLVIIDHENKRVYRVDIPNNLWVGIVIPNIPVPENKTLYARSILPTSLSRREVVSQISLVAKILLAIHKSDPKLLGEAVSRDYLSEPHRSSLIPMYKEIKELALREGAYGFNISGAGPSMFLLTEDQGSAIRIVLKIIDYLRVRGYESSYYVSKISNKGSIVEVI